ncbi:hypothetical protein E2562_021284 [Oryza meyeriana var. granulata]|uniref:Uncharacterized protein n=1 Tax=Oryza meyeriana var. granulata TaxID=110450 RepID=A0A6G1BYK9_9ORYZ|nr:hypothetical protein E2562_021284 [Oryza meyeriana var. granulata]
MDVRITRFLMNRLIEELKRGEAEVDVAVPMRGGEIVPNVHTVNQPSPFLSFLTPSHHSSALEPPPGASPPLALARSARPASSLPCSDDTMESHLVYNFDNELLLPLLPRFLQLASLDPSLLLIVGFVFGSPSVAPAATTTLPGSRLLVIL